MSKVTPFNKRPRAKIAAYLRSCRLKSGISQGRVADALGYSSPQFVSNWERGTSVPPITAIPVLAKTIKVSPDKFIALYVESTKAMLERRLK